MIATAQHLQLVKQVASRIARKLPRQVQLDDLVSAGTEGLLDAARRFDPAKGVAFGAYAEIRIRGAVMDELRANDFAPRSLRRRQREYGVSESALAAPRFVSTDDSDVLELGDPNVQVEAQFEHAEELGALRDSVASLPERLKLVLSLYYVEELTLKEIGAALGVTESRVCQLHARAVQLMREQLTEKDDAELRAAA